MALIQGSAFNVKTPWYQWKPCGPKCVDFREGEKPGVPGEKPGVPGEKPSKRRSTMRNSTHMSRQPTADVDQAWLDFSVAETFFELHSTQLKCDVHNRSQSVSEANVSNDRVTTLAMK